MGDPGGRDDPRLHASVLRPVKHRLYPVGFHLGVGVVLYDGVVVPDCVVVSLDPGEHGGGRGGAVRHHGVHGVGPAQPKVGELLPDKLRAGAVLVGLLALVHPGRGDGAHTHAVPHNDDDVLGKLLVLLQPEGAPQNYYALVRGAIKRTCIFNEPVNKII